MRIFVSRQAAGHARYSAEPNLRSTLTDVKLRIGFESQFVDCTPDAHIFRNPVVPKKPGVFACGGRPRSTRDPGRTGEIIELPLYLVEIRIHDFRPLSVRAVLTALANGRSTARWVFQRSSTSGRSSSSM
jgi:hypothetical protein